MILSIEIHIMKPDDVISFVTMWFHQSYFIFCPGLDFLMGLPFSENYRVAKSEGTFLASVEDWYGFFMDNGWKLFKPGGSRFLELLGDITEPPVS